jgi:hypothetical protein
MRDDDAIWELLSKIELFSTLSGRYDAIAPILDRERAKAHLSGYQAASEAADWREIPIEGDTQQPLDYCDLEGCEEDCAHCEREVFK